jgi:hypothetical protein
MSIFKVRVNVEWKEKGKWSFMRKSRTKIILDPSLVEFAPNSNQTGEEK